MSETLVWLFILNVEPYASLLSTVQTVLLVVSVDASYKYNILLTLNFHFLTFMHYYR